MSKTNSFETSFLTLVFNNTAIANIGDASGLQPSAADGSLYVSLHTADPGETGDQTTSETSYTNYARVAVARTSSGWTISSNQASNTSAVEFITAGAGAAQTVTHFGIGTAATGAGVLLVKGSVSPQLSVSEGVKPQFDAGYLVVQED